jgi:hypothetical protein
MVAAREVIAKFSLERVKRFPNVDDSVANFQQLWQVSSALKRMHSENYDSEQIQAVFNDAIEWALGDWETFIAKHLSAEYKAPPHPNIKTFCICLKGVIYYEFDYKEGA